MQISRFSAGQAGPAVNTSPGGLRAAAAVLNDTTGAAGLTRQLKAYHALADRWRQASQSERETLDPLLHDSTFARRVQSTLNDFTRAAWAGPDAAPPEPQARILKAFDALSDADRQVVAAMQADASADVYRARLLADLDAAGSQSAPRGRPLDTITLSEEAQARLAGRQTPDDPPPRPNPREAALRPDVAAAITAYSKAAG
jgi:hypothetical protein